MYVYEKSESVLLGHAFLHCDKFHKTNHTEMCCMKRLQTLLKINYFWYYKRLERYADQYCHYSLVSSDERGIY